MTVQDEPDTQPGIMPSISNALLELGYKAKIEGNIVESATSGYHFGVRFVGESVQLSVPVTNDMKFQLSDANEFNALYRFAKIYLDEDEDILLTCDFFATEADIVPLFKRFMPLWDHLVGVFANLLSSVRDRNPAGTSDKSEV